MQTKIAVRAAVVLALSTAALGQQAQSGKSASIGGWVVDSACAYTKGIEKPISAGCARACAKAGSPLVILSDDGQVILPIDSKTPSSSQNPRLMPYAGEHVKLSGTEHKRGESLGIVIASITRTPS